MLAVGGVHDAQEGGKAGTATAVHGHKNAPPPPATTHPLEGSRIQAFLYPPVPLGKTGKMGKTGKIGKMLKIGKTGKIGKIGKKNLKRVACVARSARADARAFTPAMPC